MKLQKLTIKNLASIEEATVDFEHGPLAEDSLFLICGETGAGKSTLLDAICLALYNETPRLERAENERYKDLTHTFSARKESVAINDNRQLMRRNTGEAWAKLDFIGSNNCHYTAQWYVARAHRKPNGTIQSVKWTWENHDRHLLLAKTAEIKEETQKAIGLTFTQFCRTTLLAQGDFTRFLQSKESEKSDILEKLTGTGIYSEIGAEIYAITKQKRLDYENQAQKLQGIHILTDEEQVEMEKAIAEQMEQTQRLSREKTDTEKKRNWIEQYDKLLNIREQRQREYDEKQKRLQTDEFQEQAQRLTDWLTTADARHWLVQRNQQAKAIQDYKQQVEVLKERHMTCCKGENGLRISIQRQKELLEQVVDYLDKRQALRPMFEQCQTIVTKLQTARNHQQRIAIARKQLDDLQAKLNGQQQTCLNKKSEFDRLTSENQTRQTELDNLNRQLKNMQQDKLQDQKASLEAELSALNEVQNAYKLSQERQKTLDTAIVQERKLTEHLNALCQQQPALQAERDRTHQAYEELKTLYEQQKDAMSDWARYVRSKLHPGSLCPVCGQEVKTLHHDEDFQSALLPLQTALTQKEQICQKANLALENNLTEQRTYAKLLTESQSNTASLREAYQQARLQVQTLFNTLQLTSADGQSTAILNQRILDNKALLERINKQLQDVQQLANRISGLQKQKDNCQRNVEQAQSDLLATEKQRDNLQNSIENQKMLIANDTSTAQTIIEEADSQIVWGNWQNAWTNNPDEFIDKLQKAATNYNSAQEKQKELEATLALAQKEWADVATTRQAICQIMPDWTVLTTDEAEDIKDLGQRWNNLHASISAAKQAMDNARTQLTAQNDKLTRFYEQHPKIDEAYLEQLAACTNNEIEALNRYVRQAREEAVAAQAACQQAVHQTELHQTQKPELREEDTIELLKLQTTQLDEQLNHSQQLIGQLKARLAENQQNLFHLQEEQQRATALLENFHKWERLCKLFGDDKGKTFRNIAQSFVLKELLNRANGYLNRLTGRYALDCQAGSLTILLRDYFQGGSARPASTLSGGESFLISLSLALGLSSLNRQSLSIDTLFIDEGFGSLSSDYLNTVMDTLEKLHRLGGRKVGIISHIEGLKERIRTQIQVKRTDNTRSSVSTISLL